MSEKKELNRCWECAHWHNYKMEGEEALWVGYCRKETMFLLLHRGGNVEDSLRYSERLHGSPACGLFQLDAKYH